MRNLIFIAMAASLLASCAQPGTRPEVKDERISCLQETGSRIKPKPGECTNNPGRVVTREEIERTGSFTTFDALRATVPQIH